MDGWTEYLRSHSVFWSRLGFGYDPPQTDEGGRLVLFNRNFEPYRRYHRDFADQNIKVHSTILPAGWTGVGQYDYSATDEVLDALLSRHPDYLYLPRVKLNVPVDWCGRFPREVYVYANGPQSEDRIRELVGTPAHDWLGYDSPCGYSVNGGTFRDTRPNMNGLIGLQSFCSEQWLNDAGEALESLIRHIDEGPYRNQVIGFQVAYGNCGETTAWGSWSRNAEKKGDYGIRAREKFYEWALNKYASPQGVRDAWSMDESAYDHHHLPGAEVRFLRNGSLKEFFRDDPQGRQAADYSIFTSECNAKAIEHFCRIVKEGSADRIAGAFYGYIVGVPHSAHAGHLAIDRLLASPFVDFLSSPKGYYRCGADGPGLDQAPATSMNRKKLWLDEIDPVTHLDRHRKGRGQSEDLEQTRTVLWREFAKNLSWNQGFWWMDLGEGAYDSPGVMAEIGKMEELRKAMGPSGCAVSQVLLVIDDESMHYHTPSHAVTEGFIKDFASNIKQCGAPVDLYRLSDLFELDLSRYRMVVFLNVFRLDAENWRQLRKRFRQPVTFLWNYAAGILDPSDSKGVFSIDHVRNLTGFRIREMEPGFAAETLECGETTDFPLIYIGESAETEVISRYSNGRCMIAGRRMDGVTNYLCCLPRLTVEELYDIMAGAGVHRYAPAHCTVYANEKFISVFSGKDIHGTLEFDCPRDLTDVRTGETLRSVKGLPLDLPAKRFVFYRCVHESERIDT